MASEKFTKLETAAIMRKRGQFRGDVELALQPIFQRHLGLDNSGSWADTVANDAMTKFIRHIDDAAVAELAERFGYLVELMEMQATNEG